MKNQTKTRDELLVELKDLAQKYEALKISSDHEASERKRDEDITERKRMEDLMLQSKRQFDNLVSNIPVGVYILHTKPDASFALDYISPRMAEMLDLSAEYLISRGDAIFKVIHPEDLEEFARLNLEGIIQKRPFDWKGRVIIRGVVKWLHIASVPQEIENGDYIWNGIIADITQQITDKAEIEKQNENLRKINNEKDKLYSIIAHDLRSPFNGFLGLTQLMAEELHSFTMEEVQNFASRMNKSATNLFNLLTNLLNWSQIQQGAIHFNPEVIQLSGVVGGSMDLVLEEARQKKIEMTAVIPEELTVFADVNMLQTILRNLVSNALKFTPKGGKIHISAKNCDQLHAEIAIQDNGIGISQILAANLFHLDVKPKRVGTEGEPSTGLGLLLCKEFVERNGGKLWFESDAGGGSTFYFTLPLNV